MLLKFELLFQMSPNTNKNDKSSIEMNKSNQKQTPSTIKYSSHEEFEETPTWAAVITVLGYAILSALGWLRDFLRNIGIEEKKTAHDPNPKVCRCRFLHKTFVSIFVSTRISFHFMKDMNVFILEIYIHVFVMFLISQ